ncbi:MAG: hypothetical protein ACK4TF_03745 [Thermodesulfovibrionales bacterium]
MKKGVFDNGEMDLPNVLEGTGIKEFGEKIARFIEKARAIKDENQRLQKKLEELEELVKKQAKEIEELKTERLYVKKEIQEIMREIEEFEI